MNWLWSVGDSSLAFLMFDRQHRKKSGVSILFFIKFIFFLIIIVLMSQGKIKIE